MNKLLVQQILRFGVVGCLAALMHFSLLVFFVEMHWLMPLQANAVAFFTAFQVSYWGHRFWTFSGTAARHKEALPKLLFVAASGFFVNQSLFYVFLTWAHLPYPLALLIVLAIVPAFTFVISKWWVFDY